jgi:hypothetical protein
MEAFAAIVVAIVIVAIVFLGIILAVGVIGYFLSFL